MQRMNRRIAPWLLLLLLAGCAAPQGTAPTPAPRETASAVPASRADTPAPAGPRLPPPAEELESYPLVRDQPAVAAATADLSAATPALRPAALMRRVRDAIVAAQKIRNVHGNPIRLPGWAPDYERFIALYDLAARDLSELLAASPAAPEAAEATYTMGLIHDYPHLDLFDEALAAYRLTLERFPGTPWALRAGERIVLIEGFIRGGQGDPHGGDGTDPTPAAEGGRRSVPPD